MNQEIWNHAVNKFPFPHILQSWEWAVAKSKFGWQMEPLLWGKNEGNPDALGMLLERKVKPFPFLPSFSVCYLPRGPILDWGNMTLARTVFSDLEIRTRTKGLIFLKMDPEVIHAEGIPGSLDEKTHTDGIAIQNTLISRGWIFSDSQIQYKNTMWLDLNGSEENWLSRMKPKTRYNLRLAEKKGVVVRSGGRKDLHLLYQMYAETSIRDSFTIRNEDYYQTVWTLFMKKGMAIPLIAEFNGAAIAGLFLFILGLRAWFLFGMSVGKNRELMPNYLLQWEAMRRAKEAGCKTYDLWGAPDNFTESDPLWGVFRFKEGLGARVIRTIGAWDFTSRPSLYTLYSKILPRLMAIMRRKGNQNTMNALN